MTPPPIPEPTAGTLVLLGNAFLYRRYGQVWQAVEERLYDEEGDLGWDDLVRSAHRYQWSLVELAKVAVHVPAGDS